VRDLVVFRFYEGWGDVARYYDDGLAIAQQLWDGDVEPLTLAFWLGDERWWGTPFMVKLTGLVLAVVGPTRLGAALVFSVLALIGLCLIIAAVARGAEGVAARYAPWVLLWPSLAYWPSTIGKESVTILALGLATFGFVGDGRRIRWLPFAVGLLLAFAVRPHVAAVMAIAALASRWLLSWRRFDARRILEAVLFVGVGAVAVVAMSSSFGIGEEEGMLDFVEERSRRASGGGAGIARVPLGLLGIPFALINVWMRPFPWEFHNPTSAIAAVEMVFLWWWIWRYRRGVGLVLLEWRTSRLLTYALPLFFGYTVMIGITFANLGLLARQRTPIFPFLFMLLAVASLARRTQRGRSARGRPGSEEPLEHDDRVAVL
jgi:hypothetical protein